MHFVNRLPLTEESCYEILHLELTSDEDHGIIDDDLAHILPFCPNLESVHLTGVPDLTDRTIILLAQTSPHLVELDISGCTQVTDVAILEVAKVATDLEVVRLNGLTTLTDPSVSALARSLTHLTELELSNLPLVTASSVRDIWTFSTKLTRLKLAHCAHLTDKAFPSSPPSSARTSTRGASVALSSLPANRSSNGTRPSTWLDNLPPLVFSRAHKLAHLRLLDISYCIRLTDAAISGIVACAPRLQHLNLGGCMALTDEAAYAVASLGQHLKVLFLTHAEQLTDRGIMSIVRACTRLKSVDVSFDSRLTDLALLELATLPQLQRLFIAGLPQLTDNAAFFLAEHTPTLQSLHLSHCKQISLDAIHVLLRKLEKLDHLSASAVPALKRVGVERFSERPPRGYNARKQGIYRVFRRENLRALGKFLDKEQTRRREAEQKNIIFVPRADDSMELY